MKKAVKIRNLIKEFPAGEENIRVLHSINTEINMGELTMLVGPSGCGKTTLISALSGILSITSGEIDILGQRLNSMSDKEKVLFRRKNIGYIYQQ
jgi:putative ABC transport system ATP-binding protein